MMAAFRVALILTQEQSVEIRVLTRQSLGIKAIARELAVSRKTLRKYLRDCQPHQYHPATRR
jgi:transposase